MGPEEETKEKKMNGIFRESFKEQVHKQINMQRRIPITFPIKVADRLDQFAKDNCNDCYWLAVKQLLDFFEENKGKDFTTKLLMDKDSRLDERIESLEVKVEELDDKIEQKTEKEEVKSFGGNAQ